ncbi:peptidyl-prolyl cis-trans isomerase D-like [Copidosoma floridanum]|uniref:peptidyl-prolyl cis-trans isomerase D-like n=1 Tax=Copidosoma floridanum TaxID=29053 RepID=UPI0006C9A956|nr:peptidyl-prolyl cis-trans isomerase D-like [Copidosoma floridanum]
MGGNPIVFLDIAHEGEKLGRVVIELFKDRVPRTAENFRALCTGEKGIGRFGKPLHFKGCFIHRIIPSVMMVGGDIVNLDGSGGESIYGEYFEDEDLSASHDAKGLLSMVNAGRPNTNSSQFIVTMDTCSQLNNKNVVFGTVRKGLGVMEDLNHVRTNEEERHKVLEKVNIVDCGELTGCSEWGIEDKDGEDVYCPYPEDWDLIVPENKLTREELIDIINKVKAMGNSYFSRDQLNTAEKKYKKALRYYACLSKLQGVGQDDPSVKKLEQSILLNIANVKLRRCEYRDTLNLCKKVLDADEKNCKALFRTGQAYVGLNEYSKGLDFLEKALAENPSEKSIVAEINDLKKKIRTN